MQPTTFHSSTLDSIPKAQQVRRILTAALDAVDPYLATQRALKLSKKYRRIFVVGCGKAAYPMAQAVEGVLAGKITAGIIITKDGHLPARSKLSHIQACEAAHPIPDERGVEATQMLIDLLAQAGEDDLVICLISGGGSALLTRPVPGVSLSDLQILTNLLLRSGATINQMNTLRKHFDLVKGGGLARLAAPAAVESLILSDVVGDPLDVIASGPTVPDSSTYQDAWNILNEFNLFDQTPPAILAHLELGRSGHMDETLKPGDPILDKVHNQIIASNLQAAQAALDQARIEGFNTQLLTTSLQGEARRAGADLAAVLRQSAIEGMPIHRPACLIAGGETTVTVQGNGLGGRNQELALGSVQPLAGLQDVLLVALATDGGDGPTDAAGAVVNGETLARAAALNLDPADFLSRNDAYHFFHPLGDLLITGPTQTNVNDLTLLFAY